MDGFEFARFAELIGRVIEVGGLGAIVIGVVVATGGFLRDARRGTAMEAAYANYRRGLARAVLLGLEFLIAADIIRTVAISPTFESVGVLAAVVLIRSFLSMTLQLEIEGRWPWQARREPAGAHAAAHRRLGAD